MYNQLSGMLPIMTSSGWETFTWDTAYSWHVEPLEKVRAAKSSGKENNRAMPLKWHSGGCVQAPGCH